jgi:hypothetical protein
MILQSLGNTHAQMFVSDRPEFHPYRGMDRSSRPDAEMGLFGTMTSGFRTTKCRSSEDTTQKSVVWLGGRMDSFWLPVEMTTLSTVGSELAKQGSLTGR